MEAESEQILKVTLERPVPYFLQLISQRPFVPVNEKAISQFGKQWTQPGKLVSNGAYKLVNWVPNERIEAERNMQYWDDAHTRIQRVTYLPLASQHAERLRYEAGEIQLTNKVALEYYQKTREATPSGSGVCRCWAPTSTPSTCAVPNCRTCGCAVHWP